MVTPTTGKRQTFSMMDKFPAYELMKQHLVVETGLYEEGWSNERIATMTGITPVAVENMRAAHVKKMKQQAEQGRQEATDKRIAALEATVAGLTLRITSIEDAMTKPPTVAGRNSIFPPSSAAVAIKR